MQLKKFLFAVIMCLVVVLSYAVADTDQKTVASKAYVDSVAETKQDIISGTEGTVVVYDGYDDETGQTLFGEVEVYDGSNDFDEDNDADKLVTAGVVQDFADTVETVQIPNRRLVCKNSPTCTLWEMPASNATIPLVNAGTFAPLTAAGEVQLCLGLNESCGGAVSCCEGLYCPRVIIGDNSKCTACVVSGGTCILGTECCSGTCGSSRKCT